MSSQEIMTEGEIHEFGIQIVAEQLEKEGYEIQSVATDMNINPQIVAKKDDETAFILVRTDCYPSKGTLNDYALIDNLIAKADEHNAICYLASVGIANSQAEDDEGVSIPIRGAGFYVAYSGLERLKAKHREDNKLKRRVRSRSLPQPNLKRAESNSKALLEACLRGGEAEYNRVFDQLFPQKPLEEDFVQDADEPKQNDHSSALADYSDLNFKVITRDGKEKGPLNEEKIHKLYSQGHIDEDSLIFVPSGNKWHKLSDVFELSQWEDIDDSDVSPKNQANIQGEEEQSKYNGVGGWLLLFCVGLTILGPLITFGNLSNGLTEARKIADRFPSFKTVILIDSILSLALMAFSIYAGVALWTVKSNAVKIAKNYLFAILCYSILALPLIHSANLPTEANDVMMRQDIMGAFRAIIYVLVWNTYLNRSKRVKATYMTELD